MNNKSFIILFNHTFPLDAERPKTQRYLEEASHYNDVKVPEEMQKQIWAKLSAIIEKNTEFVDSDNGMK